MERAPHKRAEKAIPKSKTGGRDTRKLAAHQQWLTISETPPGGPDRKGPTFQAGDARPSLPDSCRNSFSQLEWTPDVPDICEQYPMLPCRQVAPTPGVGQPAHPGNRVRNDMTLDVLFIGVRNGQRTLISFELKDNDQATPAPTLPGASA